MQEIVSSTYRILCCLVIFVGCSVGSRTRRYEFPGTQCSRLPKEVDAVQLISSNNALYANSGCVVKFKADGSGIFNTAKFFIYFESFSITDCGVSLKIYYSSSTTGIPDAQYGCNSHPTVLQSTSRYVSMRLDKTSTTGYHFVIAMSATKTSSLSVGCDYKDFLCHDNTTRANYCFDDDVQCDGVNNCPDHSDERRCSGLTYRRRRVGTGSLVGSVVSLLFFISIVVFCVIMIRRRRLRQQEVVTQMTVIRTNEAEHPNFNQPAYPNYPQTGPPPGYQTVAPPPPQYPAYPQYPPAQAYAAYPPPGPPGAAHAYPPYQDPNQPYPPPPPPGNVAYNSVTQQVKM